MFRCKLEIIDFSNADSGTWRVDVMEDSKAEQQDRALTDSESIEVFSVVKANVNLDTYHVTVRKGSLSAGNAETRWSCFGQKH